MAYDIRQQNLGDLAALLSGGGSAPIAKAAAEGSGRAVASAEENRRQMFLEKVKAAGVVPGAAVNKALGKDLVDPAKDVESSVLSSAISAGGANERAAGNEALINARIANFESMIKDRPIDNARQQTGQDLGDTDRDRSGYRLEISRFEHRPEVVKMRAGLDGSDVARSMLEAGNPVADSLSKYRLIRSIGQEVGAITDNELNRVSGSQAVTARMRQAIEQMKSGQFSDENRALYLKVLDIVDERMKNRYRTLADQRIKSLSKTFGKDELEVEDDILGGYLPGKSSLTPAAEAPAGKPTAQSIREKYQGRK